LDFTALETVLVDLAESRDERPEALETLGGREAFLGGGFKYCLFSPLLGEMIQYD